MIHYVVLTRHWQIIQHQKITILKLKLKKISRHRTDPWWSIPFQGKISTSIVQPDFFGETILCYYRKFWLRVGCSVVLDSPWDVEYRLWRKMKSFIQSFAIKLAIVTPTLILSFLHRRNKCWLWSWKEREGLTSFKLCDIDKGSHSVPSITSYDSVISHDRKVGSKLYFKFKNICVKIMDMNYYILFIIQYITCHMSQIMSNCCNFNVNWTTLNNTKLPTAAHWLFA